MKSFITVTMYVELIKNKHIDILVYLFDNLAKQVWAGAFV